MKSWFDHYENKINFKFSPDELEKIDVLKTDYANRLYEKFTYSYEIYDIETSTHPTSAPKINALEKLKDIIVDGKNFDKSYFDILKLNGSTVKFNDQRFIEFALSYSILNHDSEQTAYVVLNQIWEVHLLNLMILEWDNNNVQLSTNYFSDKPFQNSWNDQIFEDQLSHKFFDFVFENWLKSEKAMNTVHFVYRIMSKKTTESKIDNYTIHAIQRDFMEFWNINYCTKCRYKNMSFSLNVKRPKINEKSKIGNSWDRWEKKINNLMLVFMEPEKDPK